MPLVCIGGIVGTLWDKDFLRRRGFEGAPLLSEGFRIEKFHRQRVFVADRSVRIEREHEGDSKAQDGQYPQRAMHALNVVVYGNGS